MFDELARLFPTGMLVDAQDVQQLNGSRHQESDGTVMNKSSSKKYPHEVGSCTWTLFALFYVIAGSQSNFITSEILLNTCLLHASARAKQITFQDNHAVSIPITHQPETLNFVNTRVIEPPLTQHHTK